MSELLTMQDLANGHLDVKALGEAANGDENTIVTTRTGNTYPSAERAINIMFKNGGLPATPFKTKALMTASSLANDKYAMVTDDSVSENNGLYVKEAGAWVKSQHDFSEMAIRHFNEANKGIIRPALEYGEFNSSGITYREGYLYSPDPIKVFEGDFLRIPAAIDEPLRIKIFKYDTNLAYVGSSVTSFYTSSERRIALDTGYIRIHVYRDNHKTDPLPEEYLTLFREGVYVEYNKLSREYQDIDAGKYLLREKVPLEVGEINRENLTFNTNLGSIKSTGDIDFDYDFLSYYRSKKPLQVVKGSDVMFEFSDGVAYLYEYDDNLNFKTFYEITSGVSYKLMQGTNYIKVSLEGLANPDPEFFITFYSDAEKAYYSLNPNLPNRSWGNLSFVYEAFPSHGREVINDINASQYSDERYFNTATIKLPPNYDPFGEPNRLIIFVQGSGGFLRIHEGTAGISYESEVADKGIFNYWLNEGYALLFVYQMTSKYRVSLAVNQGTPTAMAAYTQAYNWVIDNFNIRKDGVFVAGKSSGGYCGALLSYNTGIPVKATALLAPNISPMREPFGPSYDVRLAYVDDFGFTGDHSVLEGQEHTPVVKRTEQLFDYMRQNAEKLLGYNPWWCGVVNRGVDELIESGINGSELDPNSEESQSLMRICPVPIKIWCATDDSRGGAYNQSKLYVRAIRNTGGNAELREMPAGTGDHNSVDTADEAIKIPEVRTKLGVVHKNVPLAIAETVSYFRRFE